MRGPIVLVRSQNACRLPNILDSLSAWRLHPLRLLFVRFGKAASVPNGLTLYTEHLLKVLREVKGASLEVWAPSDVHRPKGIRRNTEKVARLLTGKPILPAAFRSGLGRELQQTIEQRDPDVVLFSDYTTAWLCLTGLPRQVPSIYVAPNAEHIACKSLAVLARGGGRVRAELKAKEMARLETRILREVSGLITLSAEDATRLKRLNTHSPPSAIVPPGLPDVKTARAATGRKAVLIGSFDWAIKRDNARWVVNEVFPRVREAVGDATLTIAGRSAGQLSTALAAPWLTIHSDPHDATPYWDGAAVCLVPERQQSGVKLKTLEAACRGVPIVSTPSGIEGTQLRSGVSCLIADDPARFASHIAQVLGDTNIAMRLRLKAWEDLRSYPSLEESYRQATLLLNAIYRTRHRTSKWE